MVKLRRESAMATDLYFKRIIQDLRAEGVKINRANQVTGHSMYFDEQNVFHVVILDRKIVRITNQKLKKLGFEVRCEFYQANVHAHISGFSSEDFDNMDADTAHKLRTNYQDMRCLVTLRGIGIYTFGKNYVAGLEVSVEGLDDLRIEAGLPKLRSPHITTSFMSGKHFRDLNEKFMEKKK